MTTLSRDTILAADDLKRQRVSVPEWGGDVIVRTMTGAERDEMESVMGSQQANATPAERLRNFRALTVALCVIDDDGNRLFTLADVEALGKKSASALTRLFTTAQVLSAITEIEVEALVKN